MTEKKRGHIDHALELGRSDKLVILSHMNNLFTPTGKPRLVKTVVNLDSGKVAIYAGKAVLEALQIVSMDMDLYKGVRLSQLLTALYTQGLKDGRRHAVETIHAASETLSYRNPGQPKKKKKLKKKK